MNIVSQPRRARPLPVFAVALFCVAASALVWAWLVGHAAPSVSMSGRRLLVVVIALVTAQLTFPLRSLLPAQAARDLLAWPTLVGGCAGLAVAAVAMSDADAAVAVAALAAGAAVVAACMEAVTRLCCAAGPPAALAMGGVLLAFAIAALAPLWLGPLAEAFARHEGVTGAVVAVSPLSYLAALTGYDVLREQWFYANSPLGSLRFTYPGVTPATAAYLGIAVMAALLTRWLEARRAAAATSTGKGRG